MNEDELSTEDRELLGRVDRIISERDNWEPVDDPKALDVVCMEIVSARAEADGAFRNELLARLQEELQAQLRRGQATAEVAPQVQEPHKSDSVGPAAEEGRRQKERVTSGAEGSLLGPQSAPPATDYRLPTGIRAGRVARLVFSFAGVVAIIVMLVGMAFILRARSEVNTQVHRIPTSEPASPTRTSLALGVDQPTT